MTQLVLGTAFFVAIHLFVAGTTLRDRIVGRLGEPGYMGIFSLASLAGIVWMCTAYAAAPTIVVWSEVPGARHLAQLTMLIAFFFAVVGLTTPCPTATGGEKLLNSGDPAQGILRITRHPFLWGVAIWTTTHLLLNGDAASLVFFGGLLVLSAAGPPSIDAKRARKLGDKWEPFAAVTSNVPFQAIASGRNKLALGEIIWWRYLAAAGIWLAAFYFHAALFGVSPHPI
jgi:uncharacterized membrane protein